MAIRCLNFCRARGSVPSCVAACPSTHLMPCRTSATKDAPSAPQSPSRRQHPPVPTRGTTLARESGRLAGSEPCPHLRSVLRNGDSDCGPPVTPCGAATPTALPQHLPDLLRQRRSAEGLLQEREPPPEHLMPPDRRRRVPRHEQHAGPGPSGGELGRERPPPYARHHDVGE